MAEDVVIRYRAEVEGFVKELNKIADEQERILDIQKDLGDETKKNLTTQEFAAKKRLEILKKEEEALKLLKSQQKLAFDPKTIQVYNNAIAETEKKIKLLKAPAEGAKKSFLDLGGSIKSFASGAALALGAAFSVQAIQQFASASIDAFLDAEKNAERLKFAITSIGGESEATFDRLIRQSSKLQQITVFSDDSIQQAQAALSAFGLTGDEIEKTIPKLLDFATVQGVDVTQAAQQLGSGLEGAGKEFKKYGIEVSATASRQENLNSLLNGFGQFSGAAEEATKTLSGQLAVLNNRADELQESIGSKLAPAWVKVKIAAFDFFESLLGGNNFKELQTELKGVVKNVDEVSQALDESGVKVSTFGTAWLALKKIFSGEGGRLGAVGVEGERENLAKLVDTIVEQTNKSKELIKTNEDLNVEGFKLLKIQSEIDRQFKAGKISAEGQAIATSLLKQNLKTLGGTYQDVLTAQKKAGEESKKIEEDTDKRIAGSAKEVEMLKKLGAEYEDLLRLSSDADIEQLIKLSVTGDLDIEEFKRQIAELVAKQNLEIVVPVKLEVPKELDTDGAGFVNSQIANIKAVEDADQSAKEEQLQAAQNLYGELTQLYGQLAQNQIDSINSVKDAELATIDSALEANQEAVDKRRISETEGALREKQLLDQKLKAEQEADKKIRELKRKQALADKAAALIAIAISTAKNISEQPGPFGLAAALWLALGAAQAGVVAAQPIPYAKGTKSAKGGMSRVGEEGEEIMYVPQGSKVLPNGRTKQFAPVLDAMFDDKFDQYVLNRYVNPALQKQKMQMESQRSGSIAERIGNSLINQSNGTGSDPKLIRAIRGGYLNPDEIGRAVAKHLPTTDIYRR